MKIKIFSLTDDGNENYRPSETEYTLVVDPDGVDILDQWGGLYDCAGSVQEAKQMVRGIEKYWKKEWAWLVSEGLATA